MAGTSIFGSGGIVQFAATLYGTDDDPMDAVMLRDGVHHGLHHGADSMAQVRVNFLSLHDDVVEGQAQFGTTETPASTDDWLLVDSSPFGPWPLTLRADGSGYKLRIRTFGSVSSATGSPTAVVRVVIRPPRSLTTAEVLDDVDSTYEVSFTSATPAWVAGASKGSAASATLLTVSASQVASWTRDSSAYDAVSSPTDRTVEQCLVSAHVYAKTSNTARLARLYGLHISEFVG